MPCVKRHLSSSPEDEGQFNGHLHDAEVTALLLTLILLDASENPRHRGVPQRGLTGPDATPASSAADGSVTVVKVTSTNA